MPVALLAEAAQQATDHDQSARTRFDMRACARDNMKRRIGIFWSMRWREFLDESRATQPIIT